MIINLENNELDFIVNVLGELPTKTGAFVLLQKINAQRAVQSQQVPEPIIEEPAK